MELTINQFQIIVKKESTDKKIYKESTFYYYLKRKLISMGYDVIRAIPEKDGCLTDNPYYIRSRNYEKIKAEDQPIIYFNDYALRFVFEDFNKGEVFLTLDGKLELARF
jgi:hypothetical protein